MKSNIAGFTDRIFITAALWLFCVYIFGYFMTDIFLKLTVSTAATLLILLLLKNKRSPKDYSALKEYRYLSHDEQNGLITKGLSSRHEVEISQNFIRVNQVALIQRLNYEKVTLTDVIEGSAQAVKAGLKKLLFLAPGGHTVGADEAADRCKIKVVFLDEDKTYELLRAFDALPQKPAPKKKSSRLSAFLKRALDKARIKGYCLTAGLMLIMAYFNGFSVYYVIIAAICVSLAVLCGANAVRLLEGKKEAR